MACTFADDAYLIAAFPFVVARTPERWIGVVPVLVPIPWWRARARLVSARVAAATRGLHFAEVTGGAVRT